MTRFSVEKLTNDQVKDIRAQVRQRDRDRCLIHDTLGSEVHEIKQRSSGRKNSSDVFDIRYMACVCSRCHYDIHHNSKKAEINAKLLKILKVRYAYSY